MDEKEAVEKKSIELKTTMGTYARSALIIAADAVAVFKFFESCDLWLAIVLSAFVVAATVWAWWKNNSFTVGAIAADAMKGILTEAANAESAEGTWNDVQDIAGDVYMAIKDRQQ